MRRPRRDCRLSHRLSDFVQRHPSLLHTLIPPQVDRGNGVVDFQRYMVARLQSERRPADAREYRAGPHGAGQRAQPVAHPRGGLALIEARSLGQFLEILTGDLMDILDVDVIAMVVESMESTCPMCRVGLCIVEPGAVGDWLGRADVRLQSAVVGDAAIYGPGAGLVQSRALMRLTISSRTPEGLVAFGSRDPEMFHDGQGTELIAFLGG